MLPKHEANPQENNNAEASTQQNRFATLLKSHPRTETPQKICSTSAEHPSPGEHFWGTASACQNNFKYLNYEKFLFTVVKRNLSTLKKDKMDK